MASEHKEEVQIVRDGNYARRRRVVEYAPTTREAILTRVTQLLWLIVSVIIVLIAFRFVLMLLGANPVSGFVDFVYDVTDVFVAPFTGMIGTPDFTNGGVLDVASLFAIIVYFFVTWMIIALLGIVFGTSTRFRRTSTIEREG